MRPKHPAVGSATPAAFDVVGVCDELPPLGRLGYLQARSVAASIFMVPTAPSVLFGQR